MSALKHDIAVARRELNEVLYNEAMARLRLGAEDEAAVLVDEDGWEVLAGEPFWTHEEAIARAARVYLDRYNAAISVVGGERV